MRINEISTDELVKRMRAFKSSGMGLLNPNGELIPVGLFGHFEYLKKVPEFKEQIEYFTEMVRDAEDDFIHNLDPNEHPEWHSFEIWQDSETDKLRRDLMKKAYDLGWARIGLVNNPYILEVETTKASAQLKNSAKELAELLSHGDKQYKVVFSLVDKPRVDI